MSVGVQGQGQARWMSARAAAAALGTTHVQLLKMALCGRIRSLSEPGRSVRFAREDVVRLAAASK